MSRLFSVSFEFRNNNYEVIVHVAHNDEIPHFDVRFQDPNMNTKFSQGRLYWAGIDGYKGLEQYKQSWGRELLHLLAGQIDSHLKRINFK